ncbi:HNH endonuclease [Sporosarcina sp. P12(2017)]|uniref:HNH endonuclease n=1 Tax=unclassified Sporosarcina TaxID=2647733 RepID=UPI000C17159D|nr:MULTISPECIES: HNH endonuclease [unclassified Sporosarcina]PIC59125.1 HNH endonuclease [Sporosarcina sp. P10]PIC62446.1 HNH endonuclease [Sporosarcina sp. P12(2017)]
MGRKRLNLIGDRYGGLVVKEEADRKGKARCYLCICDCGEQKIILLKDLRSGNSKSCGCLQKEKARNNALELAGKRFGKLTVVRREGSMGSNATWLCYCDCGGVIQASGVQLKTGTAKSCGCISVPTGEKVQKYIKENLMVDGVYTAILKSKIRNDNNTGIKGVFPVKRKNSIKYRASIGIKNKQYHLGYFDTVEEAAAARRAGEEKYHQPYLE